MYQNRRTLSNPYTAASSTSSYRNPKHKRCRDTESRNMLSSSSSSDDEDEDIFGISHETSSGIKLCEIDSLEDFLSTSHIPRTADINARANDHSENLFQQAIPSRKSTQNALTTGSSRSSSVSESKCSVFPASLPSFPTEAVSTGGLSDIVQPEFKIISPTDSQTLVDFKSTDVSEVRPVQASKSYTIIPPMSPNTVILSKQSSNQVLGSIGCAESIAFETITEADLSSQALSEIPERSVLLGYAASGQSVKVEVRNDLTIRPSRQSCIPVMQNPKPRHEREEERVLEAMPAEAPVPAIPFYTDVDGTDLTTTASRSSQRASARNSYIKIFEPVTPEPFSDYDEEFDLKYCSNVRAQEVEVVSEHQSENESPQTVVSTVTAAEVSFAEKPMAFSDEDEIQNYYCNVQNMCTAFGRRDGAEEAEEYFDSTDFSDKEIWLDEALRANLGMVVTETYDQGSEKKSSISYRVMHRLGGVNANSSEDTFVDAVEDLEDQRVLETPSLTGTRGGRSASSLVNKTVSQRNLCRSSFNATVKQNQPDRLVETCKRTFHKMFPMHINETPENNETAVAEISQVVHDVNCNIVESSVQKGSEGEVHKRSETSLQHLKGKPSKASTNSKEKGRGKDQLQLQPLQQHQPVRQVKAEDVDLVDDASLNIDAKANSRWSSSPVYVDSLFVEIKVDNVDVDGSLKSYKPEKVVLTFPLHKDDIHSAMVVVQNSYLVNPKVQYVHTPCEVVYYLPANMSEGGRRLIGAFKIRSALTIPVSFKLSSVQFMELIPSVGIILPKQSVTIRMHFVFEPGLSNLYRLKLEGVLLYAAPFIFNRGCNESNVKGEDMLEFWSKFPGPRFLFAQTRFVRIQILRTTANTVSRSGFIKNAWSAIKLLNPARYEPSTKSLHDYSSDIFLDKRISPIGHMILRRRQTLLFDVKENADRLNDTRTFLTLSALCFASGYTLYQLYGNKFDAHKAELMRKAAELTWIGNISKWLQKMIGKQTPVLRT